MIYEFYGRWPNFKGVQQNFFWISTKDFVNLHKHSELSIKRVTYSHQLFVYYCHVSNDPLAKSIEWIASIQSPKWTPFHWWSSSPGHSNLPTQWPHMMKFHIWRHTEVALTTSAGWSCLASRLFYYSRKCICSLNDWMLFRKSPMKVVFFWEKNLMFLKMWK